jgi:hypothetical protein
MRIYLDICSIQRPLDDQSQVRIATETEAMLGILDLCERGKLVLLRSAAHTIENEQNPYLDRKDHVLMVLSLASHYLPTTPEVTERAKGYVEAGMKRLDALHLALAVEGMAAFFTGRTINCFAVDAKRTRRKLQSYRHLNLLLI